MTIFYGDAFYLLSIEVHLIFLVELSKPLNYFNAKKVKN